MAGFRDVSGHNLYMFKGVLGVEEVALVQNRQEGLLEKVSKGVEGDSLVLAWAAGYFGEAAFREAVCEGVDFLVTRNSYVRKAVRDLYMEVSTTEQFVALDGERACQSGAFQCFYGRQAIAEDFYVSAVAEGVVESKFDCV